MKKLTILGVGALLCLLGPTAKRQKLQTCLLITLLLGVFNGQLKAQEITALKVGDRVPASFWQIKVNTLNGEGLQEEVSLGKYKSQGILIDFWACWCGSCIVKFPLIDSLQAKFLGQLKILPVNSKASKDSHARIQELISGKTYSKYKLGLPTVVDDEIITKLFPHNAVPHYVWINQSGVVKAISLSFLVKEENLKQMLTEVQ